MNVKSIGIIAFVFLLGMCFATYDPTVFPHTFPITVNISGVSSPVISTYVNGVQYLSAAPDVTFSGTTGVVTVGGDNGTNPQSAARTGDAITFRVNGDSIVTSPSSLTFSQGDTTVVTITASASSASTPSSSSGSSAPPSVIAASNTTAQQSATSITTLHRSSGAAQVYGLQAAGNEVQYSRHIAVSSDSASTSTAVSIAVTNNLPQEINNLEIRERIPASFALYPSQITFSIQPDRFESGSIIAVWKIAALKPGESIAIVYSVAGQPTFLSSEFVLLLSVSQAQQPVSKPVAISAPPKVVVADTVNLLASYDNGSVAAGIDISVTGPDGKKITLRTNSAGAVSFRANLEGTYSYGLNDMLLKKPVSTQVVPKDSINSAVDESQPADTGSGKVAATSSSEAESPPADNGGGMQLLIIGTVVLAGILIALYFFYGKAGKKKKGF